MFVVPSVAVSEGGAVADAGDLIAVIPPGENARVSGSFVAEPEVPLAIIVDDLGATVGHSVFEHDLRLGEGVSKLITVVQELLILGVLLVANGDEDDSDGHSSFAHLVVDLVSECDDLLRQSCRGRGIRERLARLNELGNTPIESTTNDDTSEGGCDGSCEDDHTGHAEGEVEGDKRIQDEEETTTPAIDGDEGKTADRSVVPVVVGVVKELEVGIFSGRIVLSNRVNKGIAGESMLDKEGADTGGERSDVVLGGENEDKEGNDSSESENILDADEDTADGENRCTSLATFTFREMNSTENEEDEESTDLFEGLEGHHADRRNAGGDEGSDDIVQRISLPQTSGVGITEHICNEGAGSMNRDHVQDEDEATPSGNHVTVRKTSKNTQGPGGGSAERADPEVEGDDHGTHGNALIVEATADGTHHVGGHDGHHSGGDSSGGE